MACLNISEDKRKLLRESINYYKKLKRDKLNPYKEKPGVGIDMNGKFSTALGKLLLRMGNTRLAATMTKDRLILELGKLGVSKKEIDLQLSSQNNKDVFSKLGKPEDKELMEKTIHSKVFTRDEIEKLFGLAEGRGKISHVTTTPITVEDGPSSSYNHIIQAYDGPPSDTYKIRNIGNELLLDKAKNTSSHFKTNTTGLLGWTRSHMDRLNGEPVHVLDEFQSDWAQGSKKDSFPIEYTDFKKIAIVDALDSALKENIDKVVIPIDRSDGLAGSKAIEAMYRALGNTKEKKGILFRLQKDLKSSGLNIDIVHKKADEYPERWEIKLPTRSPTSGLDANEGTSIIIEATSEAKSNSAAVKHKAVKYLEESSLTLEEATRISGVGNLKVGYDIIDKSIAVRFSALDTETLEEFKHVRGFFSGSYFMNLSTYNLFDAVESKTKLVRNIQNVVNMAKSPNPTKKFRWDMLSLLAATGLTGEYAKLQEQEK